MKLSKNSKGNTITVPPLKQPKPKIDPQFLPSQITPPSIPEIKTPPPKISQQQPTTTAVRLLLQYLKSEGTDYMFGIPGGPLMPLYEAMFESKTITPILAKHEQGAAFMADGYARVSGKLGACCVTAGPGCTNAVTGIAVSYTDGIPILIITAQVATSTFGRGAIQASSPYEVDIVDLFKPITKSSLMLIRPESTGEMVRHLLRTAKEGKKGPIHINIPVDLAKKPIPPADNLLVRPQRPVTVNCDRETIKTAAQWLLRAKRPAILVGNGVNFSEAFTELKALSEKLMIPVATTSKAKGAFPEDHVLSLGVFGFAGSPRSQAYLLENDIDVLLAVGTSLDEGATAGWDKRLNPREALIHIDINPKEVGKNYPVTVPMIGDAKAILTEILYQIERDGHWLETKQRSMEFINQFRAKYPWCHEESKMHSDAVPLKPQRLMKDLSDALPQNAIIFSDMGNSMAWVFHYLKLSRPKSYYHCLGFASMGYGTVAPIGAKLAAPDRPVIAIVGDAAFAMNGMEVHTAVEHNIPVVWLVENNGGHGMVYMGEKILFGNRFHNSLFQKPIDICKMAEAMGATSFRVTRPGELSRVLAKALALGRPVVIDVVIDPEELPPFGARMKVLENVYIDKNTKN